MAPCTLTVTAEINKVKEQEQEQGGGLTQIKFLAALSSSISLVVGRLVGRFVGLSVHLYKKVTLLLSTSYFLLTTYLLFISDSSDSSDSKDSSDRFVMKQFCDEKISNNKICEENFL